ncbi:MAG: tetratricopeptide repeat protein [Bacteroidia bacterium]
MKTPLLLATIIIFILASCTNEQRNLKKEIDDLEKATFEDTSGVFLNENVTTLVEKYIAYADQYPDAAEAPDYLFKAAEISMNIGNHMQAIQLFDRFREQYPEEEKAPVALFFKGFVYDDRLKDLPTAETIYDEFLQTYPDHELADDVQAMKQHLGKSDDEIIREFEQRLREQEEDLSKQPI